MKKSFIKAIAFVLAAGIGTGLLASCGETPKEVPEQNTEATQKAEPEKTSAPTDVEVAPDSAGEDVLAE